MDAGPGADDGADNGTTDDTTGDGTTTRDDDLDLGEVEAEIGKTPNNVNVVDSRLVETAEGAAVIATVENSGDRAYQFIEAEVTLRDGDTVIGEWVDTSEEELDNLGAGETWRFVADFDDEGVTRATGYSITVDGDLVESED